MKSRSSIVEFVDIAARDISPCPERVCLAVIDALGLVVLVEELFFNCGARGKNHPSRAWDFIGFANQFASDKEAESAGALGAQTPTKHARPVRQKRPDLLCGGRDFFGLVQFHSLIAHRVRVPWQAALSRSNLASLRPSQADASSQTVSRACTVPCRRASRAFAVS